jgi:hypothetical protein
MRKSYEIGETVKKKILKQKEEEKENIRKLLGFERDKAKQTNVMQTLLLFGQLPALGAS